LMVMLAPWKRVRALKALVTFFRVNMGCFYSSVWGGGQVISHQGVSDPSVGGG
jgi:hypothetical protein